MNKRSVAFLLLGLIFVGAAEWDLQNRILEPIRKFDRFWIDFCIGNAGNRVGDPAITMVRIPDDYEPVPIGRDASNPEDRSLSRLDYGTILYAIGKMNPTAVSFMPTPVFVEKSVLNQTSLYPLKDASLQLPRMTLATVVSSEGKDAKPVAYQTIQAKGDVSHVPAIAQTVTPADPDFLANGDPAFLTGESFRPIESENPRIQLVARQGEKVIPGFVLASVANHAGIRIEDIVLDLEGRKKTIKVGEHYTIPVAADGSMELPSHGGLSHSMYQVSSDKDGKEKRDYQFASLTVGEVALAAAQNDKVAKTILDKFAGKFESLAKNLVLFGYDRTADRTIKTANDEWLSPLTANARAIATIQSGRHTSRWPLPIRIAVYAGIFVLGLILLSMRRKSIPLIIGAAIATAVGLVLVFKQTLTWSPPTAIFGLFAILFLVGLFSGSGKKKTADEVDPEADAAEV